MKTIGDLFQVNTKGISYNNIYVYIQNKYRCPIGNVLSDNGRDITKIEFDFNKNN